MLMVLLLYSSTVVSCNTVYGWGWSWSSSRSQNKGQNKVELEPEINNFGSVAPKTIGLNLHYTVRVSVSVLKIKLN